MCLESKEEKANGGRRSLEGIFCYMPLVDFIGTLIVGSPKRQIVGVLIIKFPEHQQRNVNMQKGCFNGGVSTTSWMIKSAKGAEREKRIGVVRIAYLPQWGIFLTYRVPFTKSPPFFLG